MRFLKVFSVGGTIDKVYFDALSTYQIGEPGAETVFRVANVSFEFEIEPLMKKDSLDMTDEDRQLIRAAVEKETSERVLITHGTDTMTETAKALLGIEGKTIVLTGSMAPACFRDSDATFNIGCAIGALCTSGPGVFIAMNGQVFPAGTVRKNREAGRFELG